MSPNLREALGLGKASEAEAATTGGGEEGDSHWRPPEFSGLTNSKRIQQTLKPLVVGQNHKALEVKFSTKAPGGHGQDEADGDGWSEEEGWDYEGKENIMKCQQSFFSSCCFSNIAVAKVGSLGALQKG